MAKQCALIIGYLLPRRCEEKATDQCVQCGRDVCQHHTRIGDAGLLCRDCYEEGQPRLASEDLKPLPEPVGRTIYRRDDFDSYDTEEDYALFEPEKEDEVFSTLS
jgi:recombinational DNA repair protein (RecF pathway)